MIKTTISGSIIVLMILAGPMLIKSANADRDPWVEQTQEDVSNALISSNTLAHLAAILSLDPSDLKEGAGEFYSVLAIRLGAVRPPTLDELKGIEKLRKKLNRLNDEELWSATKVIMTSVDGWSVLKEDIMAEHIPLRPDVYGLSPLTLDSDPSIFRHNYFLRYSFSMQNQPEEMEKMIKEYDWPVNPQLLVGETSTLSSQITAQGIDEVTARSITTTLDDREEVQGAAADCGSECM